jgi:acetyl-CoA carboxylase biotin carboxylase subunit
MFEKVLIANRGEIALRIIRACKELGIRTLAVYSEADIDSLHVQLADESICIGAAPSTESYLKIDRIMSAAEIGDVDAIHPGYGFLAENPRFAEVCESCNIKFIGPSSRAMQAMSDKNAARISARKAGVPVTPGSDGIVETEDEAIKITKKIGYPVMIKAAAGGGGIGMNVAADPDALRAGYETTRSRAERFFGSTSILLEHFIPTARHVEVQILGLADGRVIALGERDCSAQRRHQKLAEETPSPGVDDLLRERMLAAAVLAGEAVGYRGAGTVECLVDGQTGEFVFLEMNTRLQVEHPVTEMVTGIDLVEQQLLIADGADVSFDPAAVRPTGHALELRVYAEDSVRFLPSPGTITQWQEPAGPGVRVDAGYTAGNVVTPHYDPLLAKLVTHGTDRDEALDRMRAAVASFVVTGPKTNLAFHAELLDSPEFASGKYDTGVVSRLRP